MLTSKIAIFVRTFSALSAHVYVQPAIMSARPTRVKTEAPALTEQTATAARAGLDLPDQTARQVSSECCTHLRLNVVFSLRTL